MADKKGAASSPDSRGRRVSAPTDWSENTPEPVSPIQEGGAPPTTSPPTKEKEAELDDNLVNNTYDVSVKLADMQGDPNSPLYSVKRFEDLGL